MKSVRCCPRIPALKRISWPVVLSLGAVWPASAQLTDPDHPTRPRSVTDSSSPNNTMATVRVPMMCSSSRYASYLKAFTNMELMADTVSKPAKLSPLTAVVNNPRTIHVMTQCATEPVMWETWMNGMTDLNKVTRAMMRFMKPGRFNR